MFTDILSSFATGFLLGGGVCLASLLADRFLCRDTFEIVCKETPELYFKGVCANIVNMVIIGPITYCLSDIFFVNDSTIYIEPINLVLILLFHNISYYIIHFFMHRPLLYKIHLFHHKFDKYLLPSMGNAVSMSEFIIAYVSPFIVSCIYLNPNRITFVSSISIISILNMIIHSNELIEKNWPCFLVSPKQHIEHHKIRDKHYAAPLLNFDYFWNRNN